MRTEGKVVAIAQLCRWFGVPRSTFYYRDNYPRLQQIKGKYDPKNIFRHPLSIQGT